MFSTRSRTAAPRLAAAGDGYAHLPTRASALVVRLTRAPLRGLCGALLTSTVTHQASICPACAASRYLPPHRQARRAAAIPSPQPVVNAELCAPGDAIKPWLELRCADPVCLAYLCDAEPNDELAVLCSVAAAHHGACHTPAAAHRGAAPTTEEGEHS
jgi:hypothetical protein